MITKAKLNIAVADGFDERQMGVNLVQWTAPLLFTAFIITSIVYALVGITASKDDSTAGTITSSHGVGTNQLKFAQCMAVLFTAFLASGLGSKST